MKLIKTSSFRHYQTANLKNDLIAAITVAVLIVPQGMAYAVLAGLPAIFGLYACLLPLFLYPIFGSSPYLSVGPVAIVSILLFGGLSQIAEPMTARYIELAIMVSLIAGIMQLALSIFKLGFLVNFLSHPVISGFTSAAAIIIIVSQLSSILGVSIERNTNMLLSLKSLISNVAHSSPISFAMGGVSLALILLIRKLNKAFPTPLLCIVIASGIIFFFQLQDKVEIIGDVPSGLPGFINPLSTDLQDIVILIPLAFVICVISFVESLAITKSLASKNGEYIIDADRELLGLGISKIGGSFFQAFPNTGSFSRSAINESSGAKTGLASVFTSIFVAIALLFFTSLFYYIPYTVLAAIIISAVINLIQYREALHLYKSDKGDFWVLSVTFLATILLGVQFGILTGILLSLFLIISKAARPHYAILGKINDDGIYRNIDRFSHAKTDDDVLIIRYDNDIFFGNAEHFFNSIMDSLDGIPDTKTIVLDLSSVNNIDSTGVQQFKILLDILSDRKISLHIAGPKGPLRDRFLNEGIMQTIGEDNIHLSIERSMNAIHPF